MRIKPELRAWAFRAILAIVALAAIGFPAGAEDWPQWRGPARDGVWNETGIVEAFTTSTLPIRWSAPIGPGFSGPTVAEGRVYVSDRVAEPEESERVHCFDWRTGEPLWTHSNATRYQVDYPHGPRTSITIEAGRAYSQGAMGHLDCLDAATGKVIWEKELVDDYEYSQPTWGFSASPLVEGDVLIVQVGGADGACVVGFDTATGAERWRALDDQVSYSAPILIEQAGRRVVVCWTGNNLAGLDPATGEVLWSVPTKAKNIVHNVATPVVVGDRIFLTAFYDGSRLLRLKQDELGVEELWLRRGITENKTEAIHSMIGTPVMIGDYVYGVDSYGQLRCLDAKNGDRVWEDLTAVPEGRWATIHMVQNGGRTWMFNENGELIISELSPEGFHEISRALLIEPTTDMSQRETGVCWAHPAFAYKHVFARNDRELICAGLAAGE